MHIGTLFIRAWLVRSRGSALRFWRKSSIMLSKFAVQTTVSRPIPLLWLWLAGIGDKTPCMDLALSNDATCKVSVAASEGAQRMIANKDTQRDFINESSFMGSLYPVKTVPELQSKLYYLSPTWMAKQCGNRLSVTWKLLKIYDGVTKTDVDLGLLSATIDGGLRQWTHRWRRR